MRAAPVGRALFAVCFASLGAAPARADIPERLGWYEIPNTAIGDVCQDGVNSCGGIFAWSGGVMDTLRNRLIVWGGGHSDYSGNEIYALNLSGTPFFERLTDSTAGGCSSESCDGGLTPNSRHTYDGIEYMPNVDRMFVKGGSPAGVGWCASDCEPSTWTFDFATETWRGMSPTGPNPTSGFGDLSAYDPNTGRVFFGDLSDLYAYDYATDSYELVGSQDGNVGYWGTAVIDPVRKKLVVLGGGESGIYDISGNGSYDRQPLVTTGGDAIAEAGYPGLSYDPITDRIVAWAGGDTVYSLNLDTRVWTPTTFPGGPGEQNGTGTYHRWSYVPALGVFVLVNSMTQNAFTFRLTPASPPDVTPPPPPEADAAGIGDSFVLEPDGFGAAPDGATGAPDGGASTDGVRAGPSASGMTGEIGLSGSCACTTRRATAPAPVLLWLIAAAVLARALRARLPREP